MPALMDLSIAYNQALDYLYSFVDYSLKKSSELAQADFNLERMHVLMHLLGNPEATYPTIHVAGTKGKGSTCALIAAALQAGGYKTGLYTSPHLQDYCERIQIDGSLISHADLVQLVESVKPAVAQVPMLTTFEITTAIGLLYFAQQEVDAAVIEVGLGGRLDATNILKPIVSVITSLSYDHMAVLGNTLTAIAGEKAGIIKPGVPVVSAPQAEEARLVLERVAGENHSTLILVGQDLMFQELDHDLDGQNLCIEDRISVILRIPLLGEHQVTNAATAYAALKACGIKISEDAIRAGFASVQWPCRFEIARKKPAVIFDCAHNGDSFEKLVQTLETYFPGEEVILILGVSEDKQLAGMLRSIQKQLRLLIATQADHPRALASGKIVEIAQSLGIRVEAFSSVECALRQALALAEKDGSIVLAAGSIFVTAEVKKTWEKIKA